MKRVFIIISQIFFLFSPLFSLNRESPLLLPADILGAGGTGITADNKFGMFFMNPSSFGLVERGFFSILKSGLRLNYDIYEFYSTASHLYENNFDYTKLETSDITKLTSLRLSTGINGPLAFGYISESIGFLLYNDFHNSVSANPSLLGVIPNFNFGAYFDLVLLTGLGRKIEIPFYFSKYVKTYAGINIKYINRLKYENPRLSILEVYDLYASGFKKGFLWGQAIGSDFGMLFKSESFSVGFTIKDWFNTYFSWNSYDTNFNIISNQSVEPTYFPTTFNIGFSYKVGDFLLKYGVSDWSFYFDINDVFGFEENYLLKLRFGTEVIFLSIFRARAGIYKGYPAFGFGIKIPVLTIDFAYYVEELGNLPGLSPQQNFVLELMLAL